MIREISAGLGIPSFLVDHDMGQVNFSAPASPSSSFAAKSEQWQDAFAFQVLRPIYRRWLTLEILAGRIDVPLSEAILNHRWIAPKSEWVQPDKDVAADAAAIAAGLTSRRESVAARGINIEELDRQIASDRAREKALGLDFAPQPQRASTGAKLGSRQ